MGGGGGMEAWGKGRSYIYRYTVTTRITLKMGSDESHFNVSLIVRLYQQVLHGLLAICF